MCIEALTSGIAVQSIPLGFDGRTANGIMPLKPSDPGGLRVLYQVHPGETIFLGSHTLSLVPEEHADLQVASSGPSHYESYREQVSQLESSILQEAAILETPMAQRFGTPLGSSPISATKMKMFRPAITSNDDDQILGSMYRGREPPNGTQDIKTKPELAKLHQKSSLHSPPPIQASEQSLDNVSKPLKPLQVAHDGEQKAQDITVPSPVTPHSPTVDLGHTKSPNATMIPMTANADAVELQNVVIIENGKEKRISPPRHLKKPSEIQSMSPGTSAKKLSLSAPSHGGSPAGRDLGSSQESPDAMTPKSRSSPPSNFDLQDSLRSTIQVDAPVTHQCRPQTPQATTLATSSKSRQSSVSEEPKNVTCAKAGATSHFIEPSSSTRSMRFTTREDLSHSSVVDDEVRVLFASSSVISDSKQYTKFLVKQGIRIVNTVQECTVLCVGKKAELKKTSKFIIAVLLGKQIITDAWVTESTSAGRILDVASYHARDPEREKEWGINLDEAIDRGRRGFKPLHGWTVAFTPTAKKDAGKVGFAELKEVSTYAGAKSCSAVLPKKNAIEIPWTLLISCPEDPALATLPDGWRCFTKDIISLSALRGKLDAEGLEFLVSQEPEVEGKKESRKRKR